MPRLLTLLFAVAFSVPTCAYALQDANGNLTTYGHDRANRRTDEWQQLDAQARLTGRSQVAALNQ